MKNYEILCNALNLNKPNLDQAFISYLKDEMYDDKSEFLQKLNICINICKEKSWKMSWRKIRREKIENYSKYFNNENIFKNKKIYIRSLK